MGKKKIPTLDGAQLVVHPRTLTQNPEAVRAGNYRDGFVNQAHPCLLLVNSHTHPWNSWKRTLLVWLCWSAYCNYVAFNCALLTPSDRDEPWPRTEMRLLFVDFEADCNSLCFVMKAHFPSFHSVVITVELQWMRKKTPRWVSLCCMKCAYCLSVFVRLWQIHKLFIHLL